jgi:MYXO-CTERM domain-containing protein
VLQEAIEGVPIVPVLSACEAEQVIKPGRTVTIAGFGAPHNGQKFSGEMTITSVRNGAEVILRGQGITAGEGDSGGPAYVRMPDDTWRVFGVASRAGGNTAIYTLISPHIAWIEKASGFDVTPCHGPTGGWQGGPGCARFPTDPGGMANGSWTDLCAASPVAAPAATCAADWQPGDGGVGGLSPGSDARPADALPADARPDAVPEVHPVPLPIVADAALADSAPGPSVPDAAGLPDAAAPPAPEPIPPPPRAVASGCACQLAGSGPGGGWLAVGLGAVLAFRRRRR